MANGDKLQHSSATHRRRLKLSHSDNGSDSKNDYPYKHRARASREPSGLQVPLKKSSALTETDIHSTRKGGLEDNDRKGSHPRARHFCSKADRAGALDELAKRRWDIASRRGSDDRHHSLAKKRDLSCSDKDDSFEDPEDNALSKFVTFEDIKEITIRRSILAKWYMEPFLNDLIVGCFVRIAIGKKAGASGLTYRLCVVLNIDATNPDKPYKFDSKTTYKYLNLAWGDECNSARWQMAVVSESPPTRKEFEDWVREVKLKVGHMPLKQDVLEKMQAIQKTSSFVYSADTVKRMLEEKRSAARRPANIAGEKVHLKRELEKAKDDDDDAAEVERIEVMIRELEGVHRTEELDGKAVKLEEMNRRNRKENLINASVIKTALKTGDPGCDPFSRRWTRSTNYYYTTFSTNADANAVAEEDAAVGVTCVGGLVDTGAPVDQAAETNWLHAFELSISLNVLEKFGGSKGARDGYLARKQRIEATLGCRTEEKEEEDAGRHARSMSVSDYKRRRGLL